MKTFHIDCELNYDVLQQTLFILNIAVPSNDSQNVCAESIAATPELPVEQLQAAGSPNRLLRINVPPGPFTIRYMANVDVRRALPDVAAREVPVAELPADVLPYLVATRYCESDFLFSTAYQNFGQLRPGYTRVQAICAWIRNNVGYSVGSSTAMSTARDALTANAGVCRDYAHIAIALRYRLCQVSGSAARLSRGFRGLSGWRMVPVRSDRAISGLRSRAYRNGR
jgi:transglutaminase-like putative cysteine protease